MKSYDKQISHQIYLRGQATRIANAILEILESGEAHIGDKISNNIFKGVRKLNNVIKAVYEEVDVLYSNVDAKILNELEELADYQSNWMLTAIAADRKVQVDASVLMSQVLSDPFDGKLLKEWIEDQADSLKKKIRSTIRQGVIEQRDLKDIVGAVRLAEKGAMQQNRRQTMAMVRTAVNHTISTADDYVYRRANVKKYQFVSILDSRTTLICAAQDGKVFEIGEPDAKRPPLHVNCRSFTVPVSDDSDVVDESYEEWLSRQPESTQIKVLGKARHKLWKKGEPLGTFVDSNEHVIPLSELNNL